MHGHSLTPVRAAPADRIPAFARKYRVSCRLCHNPAPTPTEFGATFAENGRLSPDEPARDTIDTGDSLLELAASLPLAIRLDAYALAIANGESGTDLQMPYNLKVLSGGTISRKLSYYFYFFLFERGEVGGIEDAYIHVNDIAGAPLDLVVGQFQVSDPMFKRELRLEYEDYAIYRARIGAQPADLTHDRGLMGIATPGNLTITGIMVNGNGRGEAEPNRLLDDDLLKNWFAHATTSMGPYLRVGAMGYYGKQEGRAEGAPLVQNELWMAGADATLSIGELEVNGQYVHREDDHPTFDPNDARATTDGGFAELIYRFLGDRWYALLLYNVVYCDQPLLDVRLGGPSDVNRWQTLAAGAGFLLGRNLRLLGEAGWDVEQEALRLIMGLSMAY